MSKKSTKKKTDRTAAERKKRQRANIKSWLHARGYGSMEGYITAQIKADKRRSPVDKSTKKDQDTS